MEHTRIDEGIERIPYQPRSEQGKFLPVVSPELRQKIIDHALQALPMGVTTDQIASEYEIDGSTLRRWLLSLGEEADLARKAYFDNELSEAREAIKTADHPLTLARAREDFRSIAWLAERRLSKYYGQQKQEINVNAQGPVSIQVVSFSDPAATQQIEEKP